MKKLTLYTFLSSIVFNLQSQVPSSTIDSLGNATLKKMGAVGSYLSIIKNDSVIYSSAFGYNDLNTKSVLTDSTLFPISSNTKAFNSILISKYVEQKKLSFTTPIKAYLPSLQLQDKYIEENLTLMDLLTHRWSFPRYDFIYDVLNNEEKKNPNKAVFNKLKYLESAYDFRTRCSYGNNQYILAAYLLETVTGNKWEQLLKTDLLSPLKMNSTHCDLTKYKDTKNTSIGYYNNKKLNIDNARSLYNVSGMGNMFSTIKDLQKWSKFLLRGDTTIVSKQMLNHNFTGHITIGYEEPFLGFSSMEYGLGWYSFEYYGHKVLIHGGDNFGHQSLIVILPDDNMSFISMVNKRDKAYSFNYRMVYSLLNRYFHPSEISDWNEKLTDAPLFHLNHPTDNKRDIPKSLKEKEYLGEYYNEKFGSIKIVKSKGEIRLKTGTYDLKLLHWEGDSFVNYFEFGNSDCIFHFTVIDNKVTSLKTDIVEPVIGLVEFTKK